MDTREIIMFLCACVCVSVHPKSIMSRQPLQSHLLVLSGVSFFRPLQVLFFSPLPLLCLSLSVSFLPDSSHCYSTPLDVLSISLYSGNHNKKTRAVTVRQLVLFPYKLRRSEAFNLTHLIFCPGQNFLILYVVFALNKV